MQTASRGMRSHLSGMLLSVRGKGGQKDVRKVARARAHSIIVWSGWADLNRWPHGPKASYTKSGDRLPSLVLNSTTNPTQCSTLFLDSQY